MGERCCWRWPLSQSGAWAQDADQAALRRGVSEIAAPGLPGPVAVFGPRAFAVVVGGAGKGIAAPVVAAGRLGAGRVVAFGHPGYLEKEALDTADTGVLVLNAVRWLARPGPGHALRVGVRGRPELASFLRAHQVAVDSLDGAGWTARLKGEAVVSCPLWRTSQPAETAALDRYARGGGGLLAAELGWGWLQLNPGKTLTQHGGDRLLGPAGLLWADGTVDRTTASGYAAGEPPSPALFNGAAALDTVLSGAPDGAAQAVATALLAARTLPPGDTLLLPRLEALRAAHLSDPALAMQQPITAAQPLARLLLTLEVQRVHAPASGPGAGAPRRCRVPRSRPSVAHSPRHTHGIR